MTPNKPVTEDNYLSTLLQISSSLNSSLDLDEVLKNAIDEVVELLNAERGFIMLKDQNELSIRVMKNFERETIEKGREISQSVIDAVMKSGKPVLTVNAMDDKRFSTRDSVSLYQLRSVLCVPLVRRDRIIGVIYLDNRWKTGIFSKRDLETLITFSNHASIAIDNARLYENLRDSIQEKLRLQEQVYQEKTNAAIEKETNKLREEMIHYIVHDLRNPLTVVMSAFGLVESIVESQAGTDDNLAFIQRAKSNLSTLANMLNDILDVNRLENNQVNIQHDYFDLKEIAESVRRNAVPVLRHGVTVKLDFPEPQFVIPGDQALVLRILSNLVQNAGKWTPAGCITIRSRRNENEIEVEVEDTGSGIPEEFREKIFSKFFRVERKGDFGFSKGLGLSFCKLAVEAHGGKIVALESPNGGTIIRFTLPDTHPGKV